MNKHDTPPATPTDPVAKRTLGLAADLGFASVPADFATAGKTQPAPDAKASETIALARSTGMTNVP